MKCINLCLFKANKGVYRHFNAARMQTDRVKTVLIDLSGTIHIDDQEIPGSRDALNRLKQNDLKIKFVTNTTKESKNCLLKRLNRIGFDIQPKDIFTSLTAARSLIDAMKLRPFMMLDDKALEDFDGVCTDDPNSVLIGLAPDKFDYKTMNTAFRLVLGGCPLIAIHKARYYKKTDGLALGPGPFVSALEYATGQQPKVVGKPEQSFFLSSVQEFNSKPEECVMIGDDVRDDIGGAMRAGMKGILVKTGKYREGDEDKINPGPTTVVKDFPESVDFIMTKLI